MSTQMTRKGAIAELNECGLPGRTLVRAADARKIVAIGCGQTLVKIARDTYTIDGDYDERRP